MQLFLSYIYWNPDLTVFYIGSFALRWYSLCWCAGLLAAYLIVQRLYRSQKIPAEKFDPLFFYCFVGILAGSRLGHCLFYQPDYFLSHPVEMFLPVRQTAEGWRFVGYEGLASHGGTLGLILALWLYVRRYKVPLLQVLDNIAVATPITACFIRLGNLMNSEIVGKVTDVPWAFIFPRNGDLLPRHPGQLYEALAYLVIFFVGLWLYRVRRCRVGTGYFFGFCLASIFIFRFLVEFTKDIQVDFEAGMALNMGQLLSIPFIAAGLYFMLRRPAVRP